MADDGTTRTAPPSGGTLIRLRRSIDRAIRSLGEDWEGDDVAADDSNEDAEPSLTTKDLAELLTERMEEQLGENGGDDSNDDDDGEGKSEKAPDQAPVGQEKNTGDENGGEKYDFAKYDDDDAPDALREYILSFPRADKHSDLTSAANDAVTVAAKRRGLRDAKRLIGENGPGGIAASVVLEEEVSRIDGLLVALQCAADERATMGSVSNFMGSSAPRSNTCDQGRMRQGPPPTKRARHMGTTHIRKASSQGRGSAGYAKGGKEVAATSTLTELPISDIYTDTPRPEAPADLKKYMVEGNEILVPPTWKLKRDMTVCEALRQWMLPDPIQGVPALRFVRNSDVKHLPRGKELFGEYSKTMMLMERLVKGRGLWKDNPTQYEVDFWYTTCKQFLYDNYDTIARTKGKFTMEEFDCRKWTAVHHNVLLGKRPVEHAEGLVLVKVSRGKGREKMTDAEESFLREFRERGCGLPPSPFRCSLKEAVRRWIVSEWLGQGIPPMRHLDPKIDIELKNERIYWLDMRKIMLFIMGEMKRQGLWKEDPTVEDVDNWYDKCKPAVEEKVQDEKYFGVSVHELSWRKYQSKSQGKFGFSQRVHRVVPQDHVMSL